MAFETEIARGVNKLGSVGRDLANINIPSELDSITSYADCFRNIDDIIIDRLQTIITEYLIQIVNKIFLSVVTIPIITQISNQLGKYMEQITKVYNSNIVQFGVRMYNAGSDQERIAIAAEFTGAKAAIDGLLSQIPGLDSLCGMSGVGGMPAMGKLDLKPMKQMEPLEPPMILNENLDTAIGEYSDSLSNVALAFAKESWPKTPGGQGAATTLQYLALAYHDKISFGHGGASSEFQEGVRYEAKKNKAQWGPEAVSFFESKAGEVGGALSEAESPIQTYHDEKKNRDAVNSITSTGATVYGGADVDATTFLDLKPSERPPELTEYWDSRLKGGITGQERSMAARGFKTGTLNWSDTYTGAYGRKLEPHYSVASTRYPGGSILKATNQDGTPYNPSGKNADGIYRVDDTGSSATYAKVDFFSDSDNYDKYRNSNLSGVQISLLSNGTETNAKQYKLAQNKNQ